MPLRGRRSVYGRISRSRPLWAPDTSNAYDRLSATNRGQVALLANKVKLPGGRSIHLTNSYFPHAYMRTLHGLQTTAAAETDPSCALEERFWSARI